MLISFKIDNPISIIGTIKKWVVFFVIMLKLVFFFKITKIKVKLLIWDSKNSSYYCLKFLTTIWIWSTTYRHGTIKANNKIETINKHVNRIDKFSPICIYDALLQNFNSKKYIFNKLWK